MNAINPMGGEYLLVPTEGQPFPRYHRFVGLKMIYPRKRGRDSQRERLYAWERKEWGVIVADLTLEQCGELAARVFRDHAMRAPKIGDGRRRRRACYVPSSHTIRLPRWARSKIVVLHECAHGLTPDNEPWHGPRFCYIFAYLLWRYLDQKDYRASMVAAGLKVEGTND